MALRKWSTVQYRARSGVAIRVSLAAPISKPEPAKMDGSSFENVLFGKFRRRFDSVHFEPSYRTP